MKKKFISAMLFGALLAVPATMFVSCKDYDDDITEVRGEITTSATDLSSLVEEKMKNVKTEISALNGQLTALEEASDAAQKALSQAVTNATNDAKGYADIQAAQAKQASIDAARALVENAVTKLEGSMAAAQLIIDGQGEKINQLLSDVNNLQTKAEQAAAIATAQGEKISALQAADAALQEGITAAQSRADQAYALAEQAKAAASEEAAAVLEKVTKNLETVKTELAAQTNIVSEKAAEALKKAEDNAAAIEKQEAAVQTLKETNETILKQLGESATELKGLIEGNTVKIKETDAKIEVAKVEAASALLQAQTELKGLIEAQKAEILKDMATKSDLAGLQGDMTKFGKDIADLVKRLNAIDGSKGDIETINGEIASINAELAKKAGTDYVDGKVSSLTSDINTIKEALAALGDPAGESTDLTEFVQKIQQIENKVNAAAKAADVYTKTQVDQKLQSIGNQITAIEKVLNGEGETKGLVARLGELETKVTNINLDIAKLNMALYNTIINDNVAKLITSIVYQGSENFTPVYAQVVNRTTATAGQVIWENPSEADENKLKAVFPYKEFTGYQTLPANKWNVQKYSGQIYVTVNPTDIEADGVPFKLVDSQDAENPRYTIAKIEPADVTLRRATSKNGLWAMTLEAPALMNNRPSADSKVYAVAATYEQAVVDFNEDGTVKEEPKIIKKSIYSKYEIQQKHIAATRVTDAEIHIFGYSDADPWRGPLIKFTTMTPQLSLYTDGNKALYKKFIECIDVKDGSGNSVSGGAATFNNANANFKKIFDASRKGYDLINVTCPEQFKNHTITLKYYAWNYDGTIATTTQDMVFTQTLWATTTTTNSFVVSANGNQTFTAAGFSNFDFIQGVKCSNNTKWSQEAVSYTLTADAQLGAISLNMYDNAETPNLIKTLSANSTATALGLTQAQLEKIKNMKVTVSSTNMKSNEKYNATLTFYDQNGYVVNVVKIEVTMTLPTVVPKPFRIPAAFNGDNTYGWAGWDGTKATYNLAGSIYNPANGFTFNSVAHTYVIKVGNNFSGDNAAYAITAPNLAGNFIVSAPKKAVQKEYAYNMTTGINYYGLANDTLWNWNNTTTNVFNLILLSPVKYSVLGRGEMPAAAIKKQSDMTIRYGNGNKLDIVSAMITATNPKTTTPIKYLDGADPNMIRLTNLKFTNPNDGNNALLTIGPSTTAGAYRLTSSETVSLQGETKVYLTLEITDVWGITTPFKFYVTVTPNY